MLLTNYLFPRHFYHKKCIEPWLLEHPTCPMCKFHILKYKVSLAKPAEPSSFRHDGGCGIHCLLLYVQNDEESDEPSSSSGDTIRLAVIRTSENTHSESHLLSSLFRSSVMISALRERDEQHNTSIRFLYTHSIIDTFKLSDFYNRFLFSCIVVYILAVK